MLNAGLKPSDDAPKVCSLPLKACMGACATRRDGTAAAAVHWYLVARPLQIPFTIEPAIQSCKCELLGCQSPYPDLCHTFNPKE